MPAIKKCNKKNNLFMYKIKIARLLVGHKLYYHNALDYRSRIYTIEWLFGKTSGWSKLIMCDLYPC